MHIDGYTLVAVILSLLALVKVVSVTARAWERRGVARYSFLTVKEAAWAAAAAVEAEAYAKADANAEAEAEADDPEEAND